MAGAVPPIRRRHLLAMTDALPAATGSGAERWRAQVVLADGGTAEIRPIATTDADALRAFHSRLSFDTVYLRFFSVHPRLSDAEVERFTDVDGVDRAALVALLGEDIVAVARYDRAVGDDEAEVAFVVADAHQGRGVGTILLEHLAALARENGIARFRAEVLADNRRMLGVFAAAGFRVARSLQEGVVELVFPIEPDQASVAAVEEREHEAEAQSMARLLRPRSVAVVGAGREPGGVGRAILANLLAGDFNGPVYPVHPTAAHIGGVPAYPSILEVPGGVDLAVVAVPALAVERVVRECAEKGVRGLVVVSAGFAETSAAGKTAERGLVELARRNGMRMVGPNCLGVLNAAPDVRLNATFAPVPPPPGRVGFLSQSGALGIAVLERAAATGLGLSAFVSVGNKADVSGNDLLQYWEDDPNTDVILLYLESFGNPRKFSRLARRVSRRKPIVAVKSGRSAAGTRAASSHTAALATADASVEALFRQTGVIRVDTLEQLFDVAQLLAHQPLPAGRRVAIVGNSGGPGIMTADTCEAAGLQVPELAETTQRELREFLPPDAGVHNPVDMVATAGPAQYQRALEAILADDAIDAVVVIFTAPLVTDTEEVARAITAAAGLAGPKPVLASFLGMEGMPSAMRPTVGAGPSRTVPSYAFPESAALALARVTAYAEWRARPPGTVPQLPGIRGDEAALLVKAFLSEQPEGGWLGPARSAALLAAFGIPIAALEKASSPEEAVGVAETVGYPVALKAASGEIVHKTDVGGVALGLTSAADVRAAYEDMATRLGPAMGGAVVQHMARAGVETIVGAVHDDNFGPLVMFGMGGVGAELVGDQAFRVTPLTDRDASDLVRSLRSSALLLGYRGSEPVDVAALEDVVLRVAQLAEDVPEVAELDVNPLLVDGTGALAVDARIRLAPYERHPEADLRRLR
jgi:acetyl coenzyme A synthetase (ADP forming)-like protein